MAKIVCLFPRPEMQQQAEKIAKNYRLDFLYMKAIKSTDVEMEAESAQKAGAEIIIARGIQATIIRKRVSIPVVEMLITGLEMAQLIILARSMAGKLRPIIGIVSFANMICDTSSFDKLYDVSLREYYVDSSDQLIASVELAHKDGVDAVIGGDVVCQYAKDNGIPSVFLMSGVESVAESFRIAERVSYAIDLEKKNSAELKTLLDNSFCGIIKTDSSGAILRANYFAEKLLGKAEQEIIGRNISDLVPPISSAMLESVLLNEQEVYSTAFMIHKTAVVANMAPILMEGRAQGAILSFNEGQKIAEMEREIRREIYRKGYIANKTFEYFVAQSAQTKVLAAQAKSYAKFNAPTLILGYDATENEILAQCIHNDSIGRNDSFVALPCGTISQETFADIIFGVKEDGTHSVRKGLVDWAEGGTLFLDKVSCLDAKAQLQLLQFIKHKAFLRRNDIWRLPANVRVIASDTPDLVEMAARGGFLSDLYYALSVLPLQISPLRERPEDVLGWLDRYIGEVEKKHQRYIRFTADAYKLLTDHHWDGGLTELYYFCERVAILSQRRTVNEDIVCMLMNMSPVRRPQQEAALNLTASASNMREVQLRALLQKHHGKRRLVAEEMGVSLSTLWRYMKKYGI